MLCHCKLGVEEKTPRTLREETLSTPAMSGQANSGKRLFRPRYTTSFLALDGWIDIDITSSYVLLLHMQLYEDIERVT